jgi:asparagine N-glycosylation enzyme membrane subunit Stt3
LLHRRHPHPTSPLKEEEQGKGGGIVKPIIYALLGGMFLSFHLLSWKGVLIVIFIVFVYLVIQFVIDHLRRRSTDYLCLIGGLYFLIPLVVDFIYFGKEDLLTAYGAPLWIAILAFIVLSLISRLMARKAMKPIYYIPVLAGLAAMSVTIFYAVSPSLLHSMLSRFEPFAPGGAQLTIVEMRPLLFPFGQFSLEKAWFSFTTSFFISFISLGLLIHTCIKEKSAGKTLFLVWSVTTLAAVLAEARFGDYFAINAALLTGYLCGRILRRQEKERGKRPKPGHRQSGKHSRNRKLPG